jgi:hypothetical protein
MKNYSSGANKFNNCGNRSLIRWNLHTTENHFIGVEQDFPWARSWI